MWSEYEMVQTCALWLHECQPTIIKASLFILNETNITMIALERVEM